MTGKPTKHALSHPPPKKKAPAKIESSPELPFNEPVAKKIVAKKAPAPKPASERAESAAPEPKRFGRVPGGGPVTSREGVWKWRSSGTHKAELILDSDVWILNFVGYESDIAVNTAAAGRTFAFQFERM